MKRKVVAIIGDSRVEENRIKYKLAFETGKALVEAGYRVQSGGLGGVMEAAFKGAHVAHNYQDGDTIAIVPSFAKNEVNNYADIIIPTGLDIMRNAIVANADAVVAIGGGAGTLSEMAIAWSLFRLIIAYRNVDGWSRELADRKLDSRVRYTGVDDKVHGVQCVSEMLDILQKYEGVYNRVHSAIKFKADIK